MFQLNLFDVQLESFHKKPFLAVMPICRDYGTKEFASGLVPVDE